MQESGTKPLRFPRSGTVVLGKYRIESIIGEGGMGGVLKAWHLDLDEPVAMKVLLPEMMERDEIVQRFMREAKAAVKLKGEHVARVLDVGRLDADVDGNFEGTPYIVMEFLDGADLNAIIKHHGPQEVPVSVDLMIQACEAIAEAHSIGIIHRDIKASNFFVTQPEGQPPQLKVLDFGIATTPKGTSELTDGGSIIGTPAYMAPEQMRSSRLADARSDIWSLGVVLYEMLEGDRPFRSEAYSDLCLKVGMDPPEPMVQPDTPDALKAVVMKCLDKSVERRYQSVAELAFDLLPFASDPVLARASVEHSARLLGRRGTRQFDVSRAPGDVTPAPGSLPVQRPTPPASIPAQSASSASDAGEGAPRAASTPTSVRESVGEMQVEASAPVDAAAPRRGRRAAVLVGSLVAVLAMAGGWALLRGGGAASSGSAAGSAAHAPDGASGHDDPTVGATPPDATVPGVADREEASPDAGAPDSDARLAGDPAGSGTVGTGTVGTGTAGTGTAGTGTAGSDSVGSDSAGSGSAGLAGKANSSQGKDKETESSPAPGKRRIKRRVVDPFSRR